jgi:septal ring factor EnvC (AmiA/AmiB activator)
MSKETNPFLRDDIRSQQPDPVLYWIGQARNARMPDEQAKYAAANEAITKHSQARRPRRIDPALLLREAIESAPKELIRRFDDAAAAVPKVRQAWETESQRYTHIGTERPDKVEGVPKWAQARASAQEQLALYKSILDETEATLDRIATELFEHVQTTLEARAREARTIYEEACAEHQRVIAAADQKRADTFATSESFSDLLQTMRQKGPSMLKREVTR